MMTDRWKYSKLAAGGIVRLNVAWSVTFEGPIIEDKDIIQS